MRRYELIASDMLLSTYSHGTRISLAWRGMLARHDLYQRPTRVDYALFPLHLYRN